MNLFSKQLTSVFIVGFLLVGCSAKQPTAQMQLQSANYLNPDVNGRASPVVVTFYQLKKSAKFKQASYNDLAGNVSALLANDLLDKETIEVRPAEDTEVILELTPGAKYIGITVGYRNITHANWQDIIELPEDETQSQIQVVLESQSLSATLEENSSFF